MLANVCARVAAKIRPWTFLLLPGCTMSNATGVPVHYCGFYVWSLSPEHTVKVRQSPSDRTGAITCLLMDNMPVSSQECSCWVHVKLWRDPHGLCFTHWSVNYISELPAPLPKILAWGFPLMHFFTVVKLHWPFCHRMSPYWTSNWDFLRRKAGFSGRTKPPSLPIPNSAQGEPWVLFYC